MSLLLDTNVVSELRKVRAGKADPNVARWADAVDPLDLFVSAITIQELETGVLLAGRKDPVHGALLRRWMDEHVLTAFANRILPADVAVAQRSAALHVPVPRPLADSLIAATALVHNMTVVTRNTVDFEPMGVRLLNPWLKS
jgi:toxin FitB